MAEKRVVDTAKRAMISSGYVISRYFSIDEPEISLLTVLLTVEDASERHARKGR